MFWVFVLWKVVATTAGIVFDVSHLILIVFVDIFKLYLKLLN
jgi:hypothetical protein